MVQAREVVERSYHHDDLAWDLLALAERDHARLAADGGDEVGGVHLGEVPVLVLARRPPSPATSRCMRGRSPRSSLGYVWNISTMTRSWHPATTSAHATACRDRYRQRLLRSLSSCASRRNLRQGLLDAADRAVLGGILGARRTEELSMVRAARRC